MRVTADAAYDTVTVYETARARGVTVVVPPARTANVSAGTSSYFLTVSYYNEVRSHASLKGHTPSTFVGGHMVAHAELNNVRWVSHCRDLVQLPVAA